MKPTIRNDIPPKFLFCLNLILILFLTSCIPIPALIHEDQLYITRKYVGHYDTLVYHKNHWNIYTDQGCFNVLSKTKPQIEPGSRCYLQAYAKGLPTGGKVYIWWFDTVDGEYRIYYNYFLNQRK